MGLFGSSDDGDDKPTFMDKWETTVQPTAQQWEYAVLDITKDPEDGLRDFLNDGLGKGKPPTAEELNKLGFEGWELVDTIEGTAHDTGISGTEGSKTNYLLFKRPVAYQKRENADGGE